MNELNHLAIILTYQTIHYSMSTNNRTEYKKRKMHTDRWNIEKKWKCIYKMNMNKEMISKKQE